MSPLAAIPSGRAPDADRWPGDAPGRAVDAGHGAISGVGDPDGAARHGEILRRVADRDARHLAALDPRDGVVARESEPDVAAHDERIVRLAPDGQRRADRLARGGVEALQRPGTRVGHEHAVVRHRDAVRPGSGVRGRDLGRLGRRGPVRRRGCGLDARDERRHGVDLRRGQGVGEGGHRALAAAHRRLDGGLVRLQVAEVRADAAGRVRARERVAAAAVRDEDLLAVGRAVRCGPGGGGLVRLRSDQRRPGEQQHDGEGRGHPDDGREESVDLPQHVRARGSRSRR